MDSRSSTEWSPDGASDFNNASKSKARAEKKSSVSSMSKSEDDVTDAADKHEKTKKKKKGITTKIQELQSRPAKEKNKGTNAGDISSDDETKRPPKKNVGVIARIRRFGSRDDLDVSNDDENATKKKKKKKEKSNQSGSGLDNEGTHLKPGQPAIKASCPEPKSGVMSEGSSSDDEDFAKDVLVLTNRCRRSHGVRKLRANKELNALAYDWARMLARDKWIQERHEKKYGKNIYKKTATTSGEKVTAEEVVGNWYREIDKYTFEEDPENVQEIKNATQLLWKNSKEVGIAKSRTIDKEVVFVAAYFSPRGNISGEYRDQVPPVGLPRNKLDGSSNESSSSSDEVNDKNKKDRQQEKKSKKNIFSHVLNKIRRNSDDDLNSAKKNERKPSVGYIGHRQGKYVIGEEYSTSGKDQNHQSRFFVVTPKNTNVEPIKHVHLETKEVSYNINITTDKAEKEKDILEHSQFSYGAQIPKQGMNETELEKDNSFTDEVLDIISNKKAENDENSKTIVHDVPNQALNATLISDPLHHNQSKSKHDGSSSSDEEVTIKETNIANEQTNFTNDSNEDSSSNIPKKNAGVRTKLKDQLNKKHNNIPDENEKKKQKNEIHDTQFNQHNEKTTINKPQKVGALTKLKNYFHKTNEDQTSSSSEDEKERESSEEKKGAINKKRIEDHYPEKNDIPVVQIGEGDTIGVNVMNDSKGNVMVESSAPTNKKSRSGIVGRIKGHFKSKEENPQTNKGIELKTEDIKIDLKMSPPIGQLKKENESSSSSDEESREKHVSQKIPYLNKTSTTEINVQTNTNLSVRNSKDNLLEEMKDQFKPKNYSSSSSSDEEESSKNPKTMDFGSNIKGSKMNNDSSKNSKGPGFIEKFTGQFKTKREGSSSDDERKNKNNEVILDSSEKVKPPQENQMTVNKPKGTGLFGKVKSSFESKGDDSSSSDDENYMKKTEIKDTSYNINASKGRHESLKATGAPGNVEKIKEKNKFIDVSSSSDEEKKNKKPIISLDTTERADATQEKEICLDKTKETTFFEKLKDPFESKRDNSSSSEDEDHTKKHKTKQINSDNPGFLEKMKGKLKSIDDSSSSDDEKNKKSIIKLETSQPIYPTQEKENVDKTKETGVFGKLKTSFAPKKDDNSSSDDENNMEPIVSLESPQNKDMITDKTKGTGLFKKLKSSIESKEDDSSSSDDENNKKPIVRLDTPQPKDTHQEKEMTVDRTRKTGIFENLKGSSKGYDSSSSDNEAHNKKYQTKDISTDAPGFLEKVKGKIKSLDDSSSSDDEDQTKKHKTKQIYSDDPGFLEKVKGKIKSIDDSSSSDDENKKPIIKLETSHPVYPTQEKENVDKTKGTGVFGKLKASFASNEDDNSSSDDENNKKHIVSLDCPQDKEVTLDKTKETGFFEKLKGSFESKEDESSSSDDEDHIKKDKIKDATEFLEKVKGKIKSLDDSSSSDDEDQTQKHKTKQIYSDDPGFLEKVNRKLKSIDDSSSSDDEKNKKPILKLETSQPVYPTQEKENVDKTKETGVFRKLKDSIKSRKDDSSSSDEEKSKMPNIRFNTPEAKEITVDKTKETKVFENLKNSVEVKGEEINSSDDEDHTKKYKTKGSDAAGFLEKVKGKIKPIDDNSSDDDKKEKKPLIILDTSHEKGVTVDKNKEIGLFGKLKNSYKAKGEYSSSSDDEDCPKKYNTKGSDSPKFLEKVKGKIKPLDDSSSSDDQRKNRKPLISLDIPEEINASQEKVMTVDKVERSFEAKDDNIFRKDVEFTEKHKTFNVDSHVYVLMEKHDTNKKPNNTRFPERLRVQTKLKDGDSSSSSSSDDEKFERNILIANAPDRVYVPQEKQSLVHKTKGPGILEKLKEPFVSKEGDSSSSDEEKCAKKSETQDINPYIDPSLKNHDDAKGRTVSGFLEKTKKQFKSKHISTSSSSSDDEHIARKEILYSEVVEQINVSKIGTTATDKSEPIDPKTESGLGEADVNYKTKDINKYFTTSIQNYAAKESETKKNDGQSIKVTSFSNLRADLENDGDSSTSSSSSSSDPSRSCYDEPEKQIPGKDRGKRISLLKQVFEHPDLDEKAPVVEKRKQNSESEFATFEDKIVKHINDCRKRHTAEQVSLNNQLCKYATERAESFGTGIVGNIHNDFGENMFVFPTAGAVLKDKAKVVVENWYNSKVFYDFGSEPKELELKSGPFTQLVWKASLEVGVGRYRRIQDRKDIVVVVFKPGGNIPGQFRDQVQPE